MAHHPIASLQAFAFVLCLSLPAAAAAQQGLGVGYANVPNDAFSVVARVRAKPGKADELRAVTLPLIAQVRGDPKNLVYFLQEDHRLPGHFTFYEVFANETDFNAHNNMPYVQEWFKKIRSLTIGSLTVTKMHVLSANIGR